METCEPFDIVVVPFPFTDMSATRRRPALVLSSTGFQSATGQLVLAMVTTARRSGWPADVKLADWKAAGLPKPSIVRAKLFTLDSRFILRKVGTLSMRDRKQTVTALQTVITIFNHGPTNP